MLGPALPGQNPIMMNVIGMAIRVKFQSTISPERSMSCQRFTCIARPSHIATINHGSLSMMTTARPQLSAAALTMTASRTLIAKEPSISSNHVAQNELRPILPSKDHMPVFAHSSRAPEGLRISRSACEAAAGFARRSVSARMHASQTENRSLHSRHMCYIWPYRPLFCSAIAVMAKPVTKFRRLPHFMGTQCGLNYFVVMQPVPIL
jgi:hypothetical protein